MQKEADAASQKQDPQAEFLAASAQQAQAMAHKAQADTLLATAKAELTKAQTVETLASMELAERNQAIEAAEAMARRSETIK